MALGFNDLGQTNIPAGLTGVVDIAGGVGHSLALKSDGTVIAWGSNFYGETNVPAGLAGVVAIASADFYRHSVEERWHYRAVGDEQLRPSRGSCS